MDTVYCLFEFSLARDLCGILICIKSDVLARSLYFRSSATNFCTLADWFAAIRNSTVVSWQLKNSVMSVYYAGRVSVLVSKTA